MRKRYDYLVVGAGLYGSVFANRMKARGKRCLVLEKRDHIAGNAHCVDIENIRVHQYGPHIFHTSDEDVWKFVNQFVSFSNYINSPIAIYKGEVYNLPFNMNTFAKLWNVQTPAQAQAIVAEQTAPYATHSPANMEEQALQCVGHDIYEKLIKGYTEKQWGRPCHELPASIIRRIPLRFTYDNNYFNDTYQGIPIGGYDQMVSNMLDGIDVLLSTDYFAFIEKYPNIATKTVFTGAIDAFFQYQEGELAYRTMRWESETQACENWQGNAVVNYTDKEVSYTRIIEHKHFEGSASPVTVISREYPCEWKLGMEPYYPIRDDKNIRIYKKYVALADKRKEVLFGGRLGSYSYMDMDKTIRAALDAADAD